MAFAEGYVDVATRIALFRERYPEGSLQPVNADDPVRVVTVGERIFLQYAAAAYRHPDDPRPGIGVAWEPFPGRNPYTRESEAMVAETSAWGRAIVAALAADTRKGVASADEVRNADERDEKLASPEDTLREQILDVAREKGISPKRIAEDFYGRTKVDIREADVTLLEHFAGHLRTHGLVTKENDDDDNATE